MSYLYHAYFCHDAHSHSAVICWFNTLALLNSVHFKFICSGVINVLL